MDLINKAKLKYLPANLLVCTSSLAVTFILVTSWFQISAWLALGISVYVYLTDVRNQCEFDYINHRIKELEKQK